MHLISTNQYMRRCRDCWQNQYFPLPKLRKRIIYLDQFVISNLTKLDSPDFQRKELLAKDTFWIELRDLLLRLRELQLICCPTSGSHETESRISCFNDDLKKTYEALSGGNRFKPFQDIRNNQIGELARAWAENRDPRFDFDARCVLTQDPHAWEERFYIVFGNNPFVIPKELEEARKQVESHISNLFREVWAKEKRTFKYWYELERREYQEYLREETIKSQQDRARTIAALLLQPHVKMSLLELNNMIPSPAEALCEGLRYIMRFPRDGPERSADERDGLERSFGEANRISEAPFVKLQALMFASLAMRAGGSQKESPNVGTNTDIETVAHLLPYCDAMLMDNGCRSLLLDVPKELRPTDPAKVFSLNIKEHFLTYLRSIQEGMAAEHVAALREVYGDNHLENICDQRSM